MVVVEVVVGAVGIGAGQSIAANDHSLHVPTAGDKCIPGIQIFVFSHQPHPIVDVQSSQEFDTTLQVVCTRASVSFLMSSGCCSDRRLLLPCAMLNSTAALVSIIFVVGGLKIIFG